MLFRCLQSLKSFLFLRSFVSTADLNNGWVYYNGVYYQHSSSFAENPHYKDKVKKYMSWNSAGEPAKTLGADWLKSAHRAKTASSMGWTAEKDMTSGLHCLLRRTLVIRVRGTGRQMAPVIHTGTGLKVNLIGGIRGVRLSGLARDRRMSNRNGTTKAVETITFSSARKVHSFLFFVCVCVCVSLNRSALHHVTVIIFSLVTRYLVTRYWYMQKQRCMTGQASKHYKSQTQQTRQDNDLS